MIGQKFCESLIFFFSINIKSPIKQPKNKENNSNKQIKNSKQKEVDESDGKELVPNIFNFILEIKRKILEELYSNEDNLLFGDQNSISESDSESSDDGLPTEDLFKILPDSMNKKKGNV